MRTLMLGAAVLAITLTSCQTWGPTWSEVTGVRYNRVIADARGLAGVTDVAYGSTLPFMSPGNTRWFDIEGHSLDASDQTDTLYRVGTTSYSESL